MYPDNFRYTKEHEWVSVEGDIGTIGITDHAQHELGDIVYVDLPKVGTTRRAGQNDRIGRIREGRLRHLFAGFRRSRRRSIEALADKPGEAQRRSAWRRWLVKIRLAAPDEVKNLLSAADYRSYIGE